MSRKEMITTLLREWQKLCGMRRLLQNRAGYAPQECGEYAKQYRLILHFQQQAAIAICSLPKLQRAVVLHAFCGGHTYEETAALPALEGRTPLTVLRIAASATESISRMILLPDEELQLLTDVVL